MSDELKRIRWESIGGKMPKALHSTVIPEAKCPGCGNGLALALFPEGTSVACFVCDEEYEPRPMSDAELRFEALLKRACAVIQEADELGGLDDPYYSRFMENVIADATHRLEARENAPYRSTCFFCSASWGKCTCKWDPAHGFDWRGSLITEPNVSECGRFYVDPVAYYGDAYTKWSAGGPRARRRRRPHTSSRK